MTEADLARRVARLESQLNQALGRLARLEQKNPRKPAPPKEKADDQATN